MSEQPKHFDSDDEPLYNIGAVSRMIDVPETTLRVWERRYSFPTSSRTEGGHRLYSQREVARLQWVKSQVDEGIQISQAIKALYHREQEGYDARPSAYGQHADSGDAFANIQTRLHEALLAHDTMLSDRVLAEALTIYPVEHLILQIISPIMAEIGSAWENGDLDVATEHFATHFLRHHLLQWMRIGPPSYDVNPVVLACAPGELHEGSLLMVGVLLRRLRWPVSYLGQSLALHDFEVFIKKVQPSAIVFVAMTEQSAQALREWPRWLPEAYETERPLVCFGGRIFSMEPAYVDQMPGIFLGQTLEEGISTLKGLLNSLYPLVR